jgi:hypothetical protein
LIGCWASTAAEAVNSRAASMPVIARISFIFASSLR